MAWHSQNVLYTTAPEARVLWYDFYKFLKLYNWIVVKSSDGVATFGAGDNITHSGSGAGGIQNTGAWVVLREPVGTRELRWSTNASAQWLIVYSRSDGFTTAGTLVTPPTTPTDGQFVWDNAGSPIWAYWNTAPQSVVMSMSDASHNGVFPFHWHCNTRTGHANTQFDLYAIKEGTEEYGDTDPCVFGGVSAGSWDATGLIGLRAWVRPQQTGEAFWASGGLTIYVYEPNPGRSGGEGNDTDGKIVFEPLGATFQVASQPLHAFKGYFWDVRLPANRVCTYPQVLNEGAADAWLPGAPDNSASSPAQRPVFPWVGARPRV